MSKSDQGESFADLFARGEVPVARRRRFSLGDAVEGVVGHVGKDSVFVEIGEGQQAFFDVLELRDAKGALTVAPGDKLKGFVVSVQGGQIQLGRRLGKEQRSVEHLRAAFEGGVPVEGKIKAANKGGVEVDLGGVRAFCPFSQLDIRRVEDATAFLERTASFLITKLDDRDVVLSRRVLLEREAQESRERTLGSLVVGAVVRGRVSGVRDFGVFVDLGGVEGLVPARELSHDRVRPQDVVQLGDVVEAVIRSIEHKPKKTEISLSIKGLSGDPWEAIDVVAPVGRVVAGQVSHLSEHGAFVRLAAGVEGLVHVSELGARARHGKDVHEVGDQVLVRVVSVDKNRRRVSLAPASEGAAVGAADTGGAVIVGSVVTAVVEKIEPWGLSVQIEGVAGRVGRASIPNAETGTRQGADLRKEFPIGTKLNAKVLEAGDRRVRLSIRAVREDAERADFDGYRARAGGQSMGTLGDLLKAKLGK